MCGLACAVLPPQEPNNETYRKAIEMCDKVGGGPVVAGGVGREGACTGSREWLAMGSRGAARVAHGE